MASSVRQFWLFSCYGVFRFIKLIFAIFCRIDDFTSRKKLIKWTMPFQSYQMDKRTLPGWSPDLMTMEGLFVLKSNAFSMHTFVQISSPMTSFFKKSRAWKRKWHMEIRFVKLVSIAAKPKLHIPFTYPIKIDQKVIIYRFLGNVSCIHYLWHAISRIFSEHSLDEVRIRRCWPTFISQVRIATSKSLKPIANVNKSRVQYHLHYHHLFQSNKA